MNPADVLLVLAKAPVAGLAKTRLCPPASPLDAARIAAAALLDTLDNARAVPGARVLVAWTGALVDAEAADELRRALATTEVFEQCPGDLGRRIAAAHGEVARRAPGSVVLQIGMDTPQLGPDALAAALECLHESGPAGSGAPGSGVAGSGVAGSGAPGSGVAGSGGRSDAVLGPAVDGGWWALGLRDPARAAVLADVPMSRPDTGLLTRRALEADGLTVGELPVARDVDTAADALAVAAGAPDGRFAVEVRARLGQRTGEPC
jgi:glycosyltransferase A (GT-A) superfamily protein (DUF2064 family)